MVEPKTGMAPATEQQVERLLETDALFKRELSQRLEAMEEWGLMGAYHALGYFHAQMHQQEREGSLEESHFSAEALGGHTERAPMMISGAKRFQVERKADRTYVTTADRETEEILRAKIRSVFAQDAVVGEEFGTSPGSSGFCWYLDPIDGTQAFVHGVPLFGTLVGVEYCGVSVLGAIVLPALGEALFAGKGHGCQWHRGLMGHPDRKTLVGGQRSRARVSTVQTMADALFCTTWLQSYRATNTMGLFYSLAEKTGVFRGWGDCYGYALVATGRAEIMVDPQLMVWDAAPLLIILEEAGGRYTGFHGERSIHCPHAIATNGWLHDSVLQVAEAFPVVEA